MRNNLGASTTVDYRASTEFYLRDQAAGQPWLTKLPFPVQCVERVTVKDSRLETTFATTYSYHHGYFDGVEREFRGCGRVDAVDTQRFAHVAHANRDSPFFTSDLALYQPPVRTTTWFHLGLALDYEQEYFPGRSGIERGTTRPELEPAAADLDA